MIVRAMPYWCDKIAQIVFALSAFITPVVSQTQHLLKGHGRSLNNNACMQWLRVV